MTLAMRHIICSVLVLSLNLVRPAVGQERVNEEQIPGLLNDQLRAVELYREGRTSEALAILDQHSVGLNEVLADRIITALKDPLSPARQPKYPGIPVRPWTRQFAWSLAALHMEAALRTYERRGSIETFRSQSRTAGKLFSFLSSIDHAPADQWSRWLLTIGSLAASDGQIWWALGILDDACRKAPSNGGLLVACGSAHQAVAALPAHDLLLAGREPERDEWLALNATSLLDAVAVRRRHLATARRSFEAALRMDPTDTEARLRLAHVHLVAGDTDRGASLLEDVVKNRPPDRRAAFLIHLFFGALRQQAGQLEAAVSLFKQAVEIVPSARSAHTALAAALLRAGRAGEAADVTARMFESPSQPPDPWGSYYYGQYWIVDPLLAALRSEARQ